MVYEITESIFGSTALIAILVMFFITKIFFGIDIMESIIKASTADIQAIILVLVHYVLAFIITGIILTIIFG